MIKTRKTLISKLLVLAMCTSLIPTTIAFAEEGKIQGTGTNVVQTTGSAVSVTDESNDETTGSAVTVTSESDFEFNATTGTITITGYNGSDTDVVIPSEINGVKVTSIGAWAFEYCSSLTSITIPNSVTSIGYDAFPSLSDNAKFYVNSEEVEQLLINLGVDDSKIILPGQSSKVKVTSVTLNETSLSLLKGNESTLTATVTPDDASYKSVEWTSDDGIVATVDSNGKVTGVRVGNATITCTAKDGSGKSASCLVTVTAESDFDFDSATGTITGYNGSDTDVVIPSEINGVKVTSIGGWAFYECNSLTSITIPDSVTTIGGDAFLSCSSLTSITIPNSVTTIEDGVFAYCSKLTGVTIPNSVTTIGYDTFENCSSLTNITIPDSVTTIGYMAFSGCSSLTNITIPNSVTTIEYDAFNACSSLTNITIPDSVTTIDYATFGNCSSLTSIIIPDSVTTIKDNAFINCYNLRKITIPNSVTDIGGEVFENCTSLTSITIPYGITIITEREFLNCSSLTSITIPESITYIDMYAFADCSSLKSITLPNSVTDVDWKTFQGYSGKIYVSNETLKKHLIEVGVDESNIILNGQSSTVSITSVTLNSASLNLEKGNTSTLTATVLPDNATNKEVTWSSSNTNVATVDENGKVTGTGAGSATITCTASDGSGKSATCLVTVTNQSTVKVSSIKLSILNRGEQVFTLVPTVYPSNATIKDVTWSSSNTNVATVDSNGKVTYVGKGEATITCKASDGSGKSATMFLKNDYYVKAVTK